MFHGRALLEQETLKPKKIGHTLRRLGQYLKPYWPIWLIATILIIFSTWTQVTGPELTGQLVDCNPPSPESGSYRRGQVTIHQLPGQLRAGYLCPGRKNDQNCRN